MLLLFENYQDAINYNEPLKPEVVPEEKDPDNQVPEVEVVDSEESEFKELEIEPEPKEYEIEPEFVESKIMVTNLTHYVKCNYCKKEYFISSDNFVLRLVHGSPVDSFNCIVCKKRNYVFSQNFTLDLLKEFKNYRETHPDVVNL